MLTSPDVKEVLHRLLMEAGPTEWSLNTVPAAERQLERGHRGEL